MGSKLQFNLLASAEIFPAEAFLGDRLCVQLASPFQRNVILRQLHLSPARQGQWAGVHVSARLTSHEERMRKLVLTSFQQPSPDPSDRHLNRPWVAGYRVQISGNVAEVIIGTPPSHQTYRIQLGLSEPTVRARIRAA